MHKNQFALAFPRLPILAGGEGQWCIAKNRGGYTQNDSISFGGEGNGEGVPSPADYAVWGKLRKLPSGVRGEVLAENGFQCILSLKNITCIVIVFILVLYDTYFAFLDGLSAQAPLLSPLVFAVTLHSG